MLWLLTVIWLTGVIINFALCLLQFSRPGEWERVRDSIYEETPEARDFNETWLCYGFQLCLFFVSLLWPVWVVQSIWKAINR